MTENEINEIKNPGRFTDQEWRESIRVTIAVHVNGASASLASSGYESLDAIKYIMSHE